MTGFEILTRGIHKPHYEDLSCGCLMVTTIFPVLDLDPKVPGSLFKLADKSPNSAPSLEVWRISGAVIVLDSWWVLRGERGVLGGKVNASL